MSGNLTSDLVFATAIYGSNYVDFLAPHLSSIRECHPQAKKVILWQDLPRHEIEMISRAFPPCQPLETKVPIMGQTHQRTMKKLRAWRAVCGLFPDRPLCFLDCDTLLLKPIDGFLAPDFDVIFTWKDEEFPINSGVVIVRNGKTGAVLLDEWINRTEEIAANPESLSRAVALSGAVDQHAFRELIDFAKYDRGFSRIVSNHQLEFRGIPCRVLNETNCTDITDETHVVHYKAGWHPILLRGEAFTDHRPERRCSEMHDLWLKKAASASEVLARTMVYDAAGKHVDKFRNVVDSYEERGILHSEMLAVCAVCDAMDIDVILESGRFRGQSTLVMARYFKDKLARIISVEISRDRNAKIAEEHLEGYSNVEQRYGDSRDLLPRLVQDLSDKRIAVLLDGPKGQVAVDLVRKLVWQSDNIAVAFFHDSRKGAPARDIIAKAFRRVFFTDSGPYVESFRELDEGCKPRPGAPITPHTWRPYMKGESPIPSYGPTLAVVFPTKNECFDGGQSFSGDLTVMKALRALLDHATREGLWPALGGAIRSALAGTRKE